jgi:hypothetical protein
MTPAPEPMSLQPPKKLRKQYTNSSHPLIVLKFEDGHQVKVYQGEGKTFDAFSGETIKLLAVSDPTSSDWELLENRKADLFDDAA